MQDRPTAAELVQAVQQHLAEQVIPALGEPGLRFRTLVAANVLGIIAREMELAAVQAPAEWRRLAELLGRSGRPPEGTPEQLEAIAVMNEVLCCQIEEGQFDSPADWERLMDHCRQTARQKLTITNPAFLERAAG